MRLNKFFISTLFVSLFLISCDKDDDGPEVIPERDRGEQEIEDQQALEDYLSTHFYNYEEFENPTEDFDYEIQFDTIAGSNADKKPLIDFLGKELEKKSVKWMDIDYDYYVLKVREGEGDSPKFTDSTFVTYRGDLLDRTRFDNSLTPLWFEVTRIETTGLYHALADFRGASGFEVESDNSITWTNDYGIGATFLPSGLGYFSSAPPGIPAYSPLIFSFHLLNVNEADHDGDGIPSWMEDLNGNKNIYDDDSDQDGNPNFLDPDDDGDVIPTREEIIIDEDGSLTFPDADGDGTPDYLDPRN